jgi:DNA-binding PadR family transcriptional regulator
LLASISTATCDTIYYVPRNIVGELALLVLAALISEPKHGYAIIADIEHYAGRKLGPGTLYGIIHGRAADRWLQTVVSARSYRRVFRASCTSAVRDLYEHVRV